LPRIASHRIWSGMPYSSHLRRPLRTVTSVISHCLTRRIFVARRLEYLGGGEYVRIVLARHLEYPAAPHTASGRIFLTRHTYLGSGEHVLEPRQLPVAGHERRVARRQRLLEHGGLPERRVALVGFERELVLARCELQPGSCQRLR